MSLFYRWLSGFFRLAVVLFVLFWICLSLYQNHYNSKSTSFFIYHNIYRDRASHFVGEWLKEIANDNFLKKSVDEKKYIAKGYFEKDIEIVNLYH
jgi:hypothetical protein